MTREEQEAFEKWRKDVSCYAFLTEFQTDVALRAFLAGYRAGFEAQHYEVDGG